MPTPPGTIGEEESYAPLYFIEVFFKSRLYVFATRSLVVTA